MVKEGTLLFTLEWFDPKISRTSVKISNFQNSKISFLKSENSKMDENHVEKVVEMLDLKLSEFLIPLSKAEKRKRREGLL